jgi:hypothetical protein
MKITRSSMKSKLILICWKPSSLNHLPAWSQTDMPHVSSVCLHDAEPLF